MFCAAVAEFNALNRLAKKHFPNACRAKGGEMPWGVSMDFTRIGRAAFLLGLCGTVIWGIGSQML